MDESRYRAAEQVLWDSVGVRPSERRLTLRRLELDVRVQEVGDGPTVLFVHGAMNSGASWATLVAGLGGFRCVMLDRPGCGLSDGRDQPFEDVAALGAFADRLIVDVLDAMELERVHIAATSLGGYHALRTAAAHPERVDRMMQFSCPLGARRLPTPMRVATLATVGHLMGAMPRSSRSVRSMLRRIGLKRAVDTGTFTPAMLDWYVALLRDTDTMTNELRAGPRFPVWRMDDRLLLPEDLLATIQTPTHFLWGEEDPFGGAAVAHQLLEYLPNAGLELVREAGHAPWIDDPHGAAAHDADLPHRVTTRDDYAACSSASSAMPSSRLGNTNRWNGATANQ